MREQYSVYLVDDEIWALRGLQNIISWEEYGFCVKRTFTEPKDMLEEVMENPPDVIFTDVRMPEVDGMDIVRFIQESGLDTQIVIVSAYRDFEVAKQAISKGVLDYLLKPLEREEVRKVVCHVKEKLDAKKGSHEFSILDYDLSEEKNVKRKDVQKHLQSIFPNEKKYLFLCDDEEFEMVDGVRYHAIYVKGYKRAYIVTGTDECLGCNYNRTGMSRGYKHLNDFIQMFHEARSSFKGAFFFSGNDKIAEIQWFLCEHYNEKISLKQLAEEFYLSEAYLYELFKKSTGTTVLNFIKELRMSKAVEFLRDTDMSVRQIAEETGYTDAGYFTKLFRQKYEITPEQFRKN